MEDFLTFRRNFWHFLLVFVLAINFSLDKWYFSQKENFKILSNAPLRLLFMKSYCVLTNDSIGLKGQHFSKFPGKTHYLGLGRSKFKAANLVNCFPWFWGKNIKKCPFTQLFLFTSLKQRCSHRKAMGRVPLSLVGKKEKHQEGKEKS